MTTASNTAVRSGGCGCGGSGSGSKDCGCGRGYASFSQPEVSDALMRPRFFPGQLLTEDDLGQLVSYMTAKGRLHNRFLFGDGVVAGLEVRKHPSSTRLVRVDAGYALDTYGNDIVVPCRQDVDILALVRELVRARLGVDCDEVVPWGEKAAETPTEEPLRQYGLYLRYHEQPVEPVAPYTTGDDPCAAQACQFSRVREGFVFELRCYESKNPQVLWPQDVEVITRRAKDLRQAFERLPPSPTPATGEEPGRAAYALSQEDIAEARMLLKVGPLTDAPVEDKAEQLERAASLVARYDLSDKPAEAKESFEALRGWIQGEGRSSLADEVLAESRLGDLSPLTRKTVATIATEARQLTRSERTQDWGSLRHRLLAAGTSLDDTLRAEYHAVAATALRQPAAGLSSGELTTDTHSLKAGTSSSPQGLKEEELRRTLEQLESVSEQGESYSDQCLCELTNPPYLHPGDPAVLLARIDVRGCAVTEICGMVRKFVLSPAAVRYWEGHPMLEQVCCGPHEETPRVKNGEYARKQVIAAIKGMDLKGGGRERLGALLRMAEPPTRRAQLAPKATAALRQSEAERSARAVISGSPNEPRSLSTATEPVAFPEPARPSEPTRPPATPAAEASPTRAPTATPAPQEPTVTPGASRSSRSGPRGGGRRG